MEPYQANKVGVVIVYNSVIDFSMAMMCVCVCVCECALEDEFLPC